MSKSVILPGAPANERRTTERRVAVRYPVSNDTTCQAVATPLGAICPGWVRDLSASGIGLVIDRHFPAGTWLTVELDNAELGAAVSVSARVVHVIEMPNDSWLHGCAFDRDLSENELRAFTD
jgi:hypothetical protein